MSLRSCLALALVAAANGAQVQMSNLQLPSTAAADQQAVVDIFSSSYTAYKQYAWGHDDLAPVSKSSIDARNGWGASIADALGTLYLMGFYDWFNEAVDYIGTVDFSTSKTNDTVNLFETTIRYVGGFISAYELAANNGTEYPVLVQKAEQVAQKMAYAWVGSNALPYNSINFTDSQPTVASSGIAAAGTLTLEWNRLSLYAKNDTYRQLAEKAAQYIMNNPGPPLPGMPAQEIDPTSGQPIGAYVTWGGGSDSYFEYLIKYPRLTNTDDPAWVNAWLTAVDTSIKRLLRTSTVGDWTYLADYDGSQIIHVGSHLACFYGGNWILGGKLTNNDTIVNIGLQLTDACWNTYASTATGIGPENFAFISSDGGGGSMTTEQTQYYEEHGHYITGSDYILRPEVLESNFYAWRVTGDTKYLDRAASAIKSFQEYLPTTVAYTGINDVNNKVTSSKIDDMESFWFAEVLKYLYLTFDDPTRISLDDYVFNTECHPFKAPTAKASY